MKFLPEYDFASMEPVRTKVQAVLLTASLCLGLILPALAEKIEHIESAPIQHPKNAVLEGIFTLLNYVSGIAILAALVLCGVWFFQKKPDVDDAGVQADATVVDVKSTTDAEPVATAAATADSKEPESKSEPQAEETKSAENAAAESPAEPKASEPSKDSEPTGDEPKADEKPVDEVQAEAAKEDETPVSDSNAADAPKTDENPAEESKSDDGQAASAAPTNDKSGKGGKSKKDKSKKG